MAKIAPGVTLSEPDRAQLQQVSEISIQFRAVPHRSFPVGASLG
jgi:hypothetical protein